MIKAMMQIKLVKWDVFIKWKVVVPLKYLSNFWRTFEMPLINCEIELILTWSKNFVVADITARAAGDNNDPSAIVAPARLELEIKDTSL